MTPALAHVLRHLRRVVALPEPVPDSVLLGRFSRGRDEAAFADLVARHGPMVRRVCRRVLADASVAEDCFQATFLVLARKASSLRRPAALASWLHGVALRVAKAARRAGVRDRLCQLPANAPEASDPHPDPLEELTAREFLVAVEEEVQRLPEVNRLPLILCCLEGLSEEEAARRLGWTRSSLRGRLARGRKRLHSRLVKRGLTLAAAVFTTELSRGAAAAAIADGSAAAMAKQARIFVAPRTAAGEGTSGLPTLWAEAVLQTMAAAKLKGLGLILVVLVIAIAGAGKLAQQTLGGKAPEAANQGMPKESVEQPPAVVQAQRAELPRFLDPDTGPVVAGVVTRTGPAVFDSQSRDLQMSPQEIWSLAFSPDGKTLATAGGLQNQPGELQFWSTAGGTLRLWLQEPLGIRSLAFSADGRTLVTADFRDKIKVRDPATGQVRTVLQNLGGVNHVAVSPNGKLLATAGPGFPSVAKIWDLAEGRIVRVLKGHVGRVWCVAFSKDGRTLASAGDDQTARLWDVDSGQEKHTLKGHKQEVEFVAFSPDGTMLATASWDKSIKLWDVASGTELATLEGHTLQVLALAFSPDGKLLASAGGRWGDHEFDEPTAADPPGEVKLWDVNTRKELADLRGHKNRVWTVAFSPDAKTLASAGWDKTVKLWDVDGRKESKTLRVPVAAQSQPILALAISHRGLALADDDGAVRLHDLASGNLRLVLKAHADVTTCLAFSPDGKTLATGGPDKLIKLWDTATGKARLALKGHTSWVYALAFTADGRILASGGYDKTIRFWDPVSGKEQARLSGHRASVRAVAFTADGKTLASGGGDRTIRLWDVAGRKEQSVLKGHEGSVRALAFAPAGRILASASEDGTVKIWDLDKGKEKSTLQANGEIWALAFSPRGRTLVTGSSNGAVLVWDSETGRKWSNLPGHPEGVTGLAFTQDGRELLTASFDKTVKRWRENTNPFREIRSIVATTGGPRNWTNRVAVTPDGRRALTGDGRSVRLWDLDRGQETFVLSDRGPGCWAVAFSRDGGQAITGGTNGVAHIWDVLSGKEIRSLAGHKGAIWGAALLPDGKRAITGSMDRSIRLWDVGTGRELRSFPGVKERVRCLALSPDGKLVAAGMFVDNFTTDTYIGLWDVEQGILVLSFHGHTQPISSIAFSPDGKQLLSSSYDATVRLWDVATGKELKCFMGHAGGIEYAAFSPDGSRVISCGYRKDATVRLWDVASGKQLFCSRPYGNGFLSVAILPDGSHALTTDKDGMLRVWQWSRKEDGVPRKN